MTIVSHLQYTCDDYKYITRVEHALLHMYLLHTYVLLLYF